MVETGSLFDRFMPHGVCYQWRADILWLNVISDLIIASAYFLIPAALVYYMRKRPDTAFPAMVYMFCLFITACGFTHLMGVWMVWNGQYGLHGIMKAFTACVSIATAVMLYPLTPKLLALRSASELEKANADLQKEMEQRKQSEQQALKLQGEIARFGRITTVGQMATGLAHELNQPLLAITASADTAMQVAKTLPVESELLYECLDDVQQDTRRAGDIIKTLRQFVSKKSTSRALVDINNLVNQAVQLVSADARNSDVELVVKANDLPAVSVNSVQIAQVLVNLLRNSIEATSDLARTTEPDNKRRVIVESACDGEEVSVSVNDNGPGLKNLADPFVAFESNKSDGMGVGLSISRDIIRAHGGKIEYRPNSPVGASFVFSLPVVAPQAIQELYNRVIN